MQRLNTNPNHLLFSLGTEEPWAEAQGSRQPRDRGDLIVRMRGLIVTCIAD